MTAPLPQMTPEEYLAFDDASDGKHEYVDGYVYAMSGARQGHVLLTVNIITALRTRVRGRGCSTYAVDLRVRAGSGRMYTYPDVVALCGESAFANDEFDTLLNPSVILEVLSDSTATYDRGEKFAHYRTIGPLREYVLLSQREVRVERFVRGEGGQWVLAVLEGLDAMLELPSVGCEIPLAELYEDVELPPRAPGLRVIREAPPAYAAGGRTVTAPERLYTPAEYLAFEDAAETKHEYVDGRIYAMSGVNRNHDRIIRNVYRELESRLRGRPCEYFTDDMRVKVSTTGLYTYPDASALRGEPVFEDDTPVDTLTNPSVIVEVLSDSTEGYDRGAKFAHYRRLPSLREYVLVSQHFVHAERYTPGVDPTAEWARTDADGPDGVIELPSIGVVLRLADLYERVEFPVRPPWPRLIREPTPAYAADVATA